MKIRFYIITIIYCLTLSFGSHGQGNSLKQPLRGKVIDTVYCENDSAQSYALFLPSYYTDSSSFPIIYFLEPRARGKLPVALYKDLAENSGIILAGSNNSKNGPVQISYDAFQAMKEDTDKKFDIDASSVFTSGFSGGGRIAQDIAFNDHSISGVITVAGPKLYPNNDFSPSQKTLYVGLVGTKDMNYAEHVDFAKELNTQKIKNNYFTYNLSSINKLV